MCDDNSKNQCVKGSFENMIKMLTVWETPVWDDKPYESCSCPGTDISFVVGMCCHSQCQKCCIHQTGDRVSQNERERDNKCTQQRLQEAADGIVLKITADKARKITKKYKSRRIDSYIKKAAKNGSNSCHFSHLAELEIELLEIKGYEVYADAEDKCFTVKW